MKLATHQHLVPWSRKGELQLHSPTCLHSVVLQSIMDSFTCTLDTVIPSTPTSSKCSIPFASRFPTKFLHALLPCLLYASPVLSLILSFFCVVKSTPEVKVAIRKLKSVSRQGWISDRHISCPFSVALALRKNSSETL